MLGLLEKFTSLSELIGQSALQNIDSDQILLMDSISWEIYETLLQNLPDNSHYRLKYLAGTLEIMSPSRRHEFDKKIIALLLETYFLELDIDFYPLGSTTFRKQAAVRGIEPDECYCFDREKSISDIAIEVVVTNGGIDDLAIYKGLEVPEVWFWQNNHFALYSLEGDEYQPISRSKFLPNLDLDLLARLVISGDKPKEIISNFRQIAPKSISGLTAEVR